MPPKSMFKNNSRNPAYWLQYYTKKYEHVLSGSYDPDTSKIESFRNYVLRTICEPTIDRRGGFFTLRFNCLFALCSTKCSSFASKQKYFEHVVNCHGHELPGEGAFLVKNDSNFIVGGFQCISCAHKYSRKDKFLAHLATNEECRSFSSIYFLRGRHPVKKSQTDFKHRRAFFKTEAACIANEENKMNLLESSFSMFGFCEKIHTHKETRRVPWRSHSMPKRKKSLERDVILATRYRLDVLKVEQSTKVFKYLYMRRVQESDDKQKIFENNLQAMKRAHSATTTKRVVAASKHFIS
jgi:hypothetical protein